MEKIKLDDGSEIDLKPALQPDVDYGDWVLDKSIALIKISIDEIDFKYFNNKLDYKELYFIEDEFWFDLGDFYFLLSSDDYLYERIYNKKFILVFLNRQNEQLLTLNFSKKTNG